MGHPTDEHYITLSGDGIYGADTTFVEVPSKFDAPEVHNYRSGKKGKYLKVGASWSSWKLKPPTSSFVSWWPWAMWRIGRFWPNSWTTLR
jgi:hypothetical protein